jgi:transcriptional regulator with XRE-family HTH domain
MRSLEYSTLIDLIAVTSSATLFRMRANLLRCILPATWIAGQLRTALASLTGIYQTYLSRVERGQVMPSVITLMQIAGPLGVDKLILRLRSSLKTIVSRLTYLTSCPDNPLNVPILAHSGLARIAVHLNPRIIMLLGIETTIYLDRCFDIREFRPMKINNNVAYFGSVEPRLALDPL